MSKIKIYWIINTGGEKNERIEDSVLSFMIMMRTIYDKNCEIMVNTYIEIFEEIADEIIKGRLDLILSKLEGAIKYV